MCGKLFILYLSQTCSIVSVIMVPEYDCAGKI